MYSSETFTGSDLHVVPTNVCDGHHLLLQLLRLHLHQLLWAGGVQVLQRGGEGAGGGAVRRPDPPLQLQHQRRGTWRPRRARRMGTIINQTSNIWKMQLKDSGLCKILKHHNFLIQISSDNKKLLLIENAYFYTYFSFLAEFGINIWFVQLFEIICSILWC